MSSSPNLKDFPLLPRVIPYDEPHKRLCDMLLSGKIPLKEAAKFFWIPGVGFHQNLYYSTLQWMSFRNSGSNTLAVGRDLQIALENTEIDLSPADLKVPVSTLYVALPDSPRKVWGGPAALWRTLGGAFISFSKGARSVYNAAEDKWEDDVPPPEDKRLNLGGISILLWGIGKDMVEDSSFWISIDLVEMLLRGESYEEYVNRLLWEEKDPAKNLTKFCGIFAIPEETRSIEPTWLRMRDEAKKSLNTILNLLGFLTSTSFTFKVDAETKKADEEREALEASMKRKKSTKKIRKAIAQFDKLPQERIILVGTDEELPTSQGPLKEKGYWTPRRHRLGKFLSTALFTKDDLRKALEPLRKELSEAKEVKVCAEKTGQIMVLEDHLLSVEEVIEDLTQKISQRLVWVKPTSEGAEVLPTGKSSQEPSL